ncbi:hypothetical protein C5C10_00370 [Rathayibacter sp. AY1A3]|nr:hypothetical protein C5C10_00370 [Rathayibacter sp. AY1A3]
MSSDAGEFLEWAERDLASEVEASRAAQSCSAEAVPFQLGSKGGRLHRLSAFHRGEEPSLSGILGPGAGSISEFERELRQDRREPDGFVSESD